MSVTTQKFIRERNQAIKTTNEPIQNSCTVPSGGMGGRRKNGNHCKIKKRTNSIQDSVGKEENE
jgi:hypothetical protein